MPVKLLINPPKEVRPEGAIRADVAWKLFLPEYMGDIPEIGKARVDRFNHWLWSELSTRLGFLRNKPENLVYVITPDLTDAGREHLVRLCSFWTNEVFAVQASGDGFNLGATGENMWIAPVVNINESPGKGTLLSKYHEESAQEVHTFFTPLLGETRSYIRAYTIEKGGTYSRFHSHTAREELYLVLKGTGTVRIADHSVRVSEGDLISKPLGPDIATQFLADDGQELRILDIEIWPDSERRSKDLVSYPDHAELDLFGQGWNMMIPSDAVQGFEDAMGNYDKGYRRRLDGSWEPKDMPGFKKREK